MPGQSHGLGLNRPGQPVRDRRPVAGRSQKTMEQDEGHDENTSVQGQEDLPGTVTILIISIMNPTLCA